MSCHVKDQGCWVLKIKFFGQKSTYSINLSSAKLQIMWTFKAFQALRILFPCFLPSLVMIGLLMELNLASCRNSKSSSDEDISSNLFFGLAAFWISSALKVS